MKCKFFFLLVLGLLAIQFPACQRRSFDPILAGTFFPLQPGFTWTYRIIDQDRGATRILTERALEGARLQRGKVESEYTSPNGVFDSSTIYVPENGYLTRRLIIGKGASITAEAAFLPQVLKPNLTWSNYLAPFGQEPDTLHFTQTHRTFFEAKTIEVPAGNFNGCIRIETTARNQHSFQDVSPPELEYIDWYAPHVGLVKTLIEHGGLFGSEIARVELLSFRYLVPKTTRALPVSASKGTAAAFVWPRSQGRN